MFLVVAVWGVKRDRGIVLTRKVGILDVLEDYVMFVVSSKPDISAIF